MKVKLIFLRVLDFTAFWIYRVLRTRGLRGIRFGIFVRSRARFSPFRFLRVSAFLRQVFFYGLLSIAAGVQAAPQLYTAEIVNIYPHNNKSFTQGLIFDNDLLYESTGQYGQSRVNVIELETGKIIRSIRLDGLYFGEGLAVKEDQLVQLTYREYRGFIYDKQTLKRTGSFRYSSEGWGLTWDGEHFIMSNGSARLYFLNPDDYARVRSLDVKEGDAPVLNLNELEYIDGLIYANIWQSNTIVKISPETGEVVGKADLTMLADRYKKGPQVDVLNGIAWDADKKRLFVTGKYWPELFEIHLKPVDQF